MADDDFSFSDIRSAVTAALTATDKDKGADLCVCDLGSDWVVYSDPDTDGAGYYKCGFSMDGDGKVTLGPDKTKVARKTVYESIDSSKAPSQPKNLKDAASRVRQEFANARKAMVYQQKG